MLSISYMFNEGRLSSALKSGALTGLGSGLLTYAVNRDIEGAAEHAAKFGSKVGAAMTAFSAATYDKDREEAIKKLEDRLKKKKM
jgi:hypothetical protein